MKDVLRCEMRKDVTLSNSVKNSIYLYKYSSYPNKFEYKVKIFDGVTRCHISHLVYSNIILRDKLLAKTEVIIRNF